MTYATLYRTDAPQDLPFAEYYQPQLHMELLNNNWAYFVREKHAWFDPETKKPVSNTYTLNLEEGFSSVEEAMARYERQIQQRVSEGFVHSFSIEPPEGFVYRYLGPNREGRVILVDLTEKGPNQLKAEKLRRSFCREEDCQELFSFWLWHRSVYSFCGLHGFWSCPH